MSTKCRSNNNTSRRILHRPFTFLYLSSKESLGIAIYYRPDALSVAKLNIVKAKMD